MERRRPLVPGLASGALFAFATSFDEVVIVLFMAGPEQRTLPREMFSGIRENISPTITAAAVILTMSGGKVATCSIGLTNVAETPLWAEEAAKILAGSALDAAAVKAAVAAAEAITAPATDARGPARYRTKMAGVMLARALARAKSRAA